MCRADKYAETTSGKLARSFDELVEATFPDGNIPVDVVASATAALVGSYCCHLPPRDRVLILSQQTDVMFGIFDDNPDTDILLN